MSVIQRSGRRSRKLSATQLDGLVSRTLSTTGEQTPSDTEIPQPTLWEFVRAAWHVLEAVSRGEIQNLLINIPPRHMKSLLVSVFWPCWEWGARRRPDLR